MRATLFAVGLVVGIMGSSFAAAEPLSCKDMTEFSNALRAAADYISGTEGDFSDNEEMENNMDKLLSVLDEFADQEQNPGFSDALGKANIIWGKEEWKGDDVQKFKQAFNATAVALDDIAKTRCQ
jgi:hypothetical protein